MASQIGQKSDPTGGRMSSSVITAIEHRLREAAYDISLNVELPSAVESGVRQESVPIRPAIVASKFYFCWKALSYISQNIFIVEVRDVGVLDFVNFSAAAAQFSKQTRSPQSYLTATEKSWLSMRLGGTAPRIKARGSYITIPIIATNTPNQELLIHCAAKPRLIMPMFCLPAVIDTASGAVYYYRGGAILGGTVLSEMRSVLSGLIAPTVAAAMA
jgi:hypothetical protein